MGTTSVKTTKFAIHFVLCNGLYSKHKRKILL